MKLEVGKTYEYDPNHPRCVFLTDREETSGGSFITITNIDEDGRVYYRYRSGWTSEQQIGDFIAALTPLTPLEKELY
jgi:hypothetical protein